MVNPNLLDVVKLHDGAIIPAYQSAGAGCFDIHALIEDGAEFYLNIGRPVNFRTGLAFEIPPGWVMEVYSRSGHGFTYGVRLVNGVGIIDSDYRGELNIGLVCTHFMPKMLCVKHGDRIAQAKLVPAPQWQLREVAQLSTTQRGTGGFGSTGR